MTRDQMSSSSSATTLLLHDSGDRPERGIGCSAYHGQHRVSDVSRIEGSGGRFIEERKKGMKVALVRQRDFHSLALNTHAADEPADTASMITTLCMEAIRP